MKGFLHKIGDKLGKHHPPDAESSGGAAPAPAAAAAPAAKGSGGSGDVSPGNWQTGSGAEKEGTCVKVNQGAIKWTHSKQQTINLDIKQNNWEGFDSVKMQIHNAKESITAAFLVVESRSDPNDYAYYKTKIPLDFKGWKEIVVPFASFDVARTPAGWKKVDKVTMTWKGWGQEAADANVTMVIDGFVLCKGTSGTDPARVKEIAASLGPAPTMFAPPIEDRAGWDPKAEEIKNRGVIQLAEENLKKPIPDCTDALYLEFYSSGDRMKYEGKNGELNERLAAFVLAEAAENQGRFLEAAENELKAIIKQKTWVLPAHDKTKAAFEGKDKIIDLGAAQRGWTVAIAYGILKSKLSADTKTAVEKELRARLLDPYLEVVRGKRQPYHWWAGNFNWNAVCHAGAVGTALIVIDSKDERAEFIASAEAQLPKYLSGFPDDGACPEGLSYWNYGFGAYVMIAQAMSMATSNKVDLFTDPKIPNITTYPLRLGVTKKLFPAFGDTARGDKPDPWLENFLYDRIKTPRPGKPHGSYVRLRKYLYVGTFSLFQVPDPKVIIQRREAVRKVDFAPHTELDSMGIHIFRGKGECQMGAAVKGGSNGIPHCHHDLGHFNIDIKGNELVSDIGIGVYTKDSFGPNRFKNTLYNSYGHATPYPAKTLQKESTDAKAVVLKNESNGTVDTLVFDLKSAYDVPSLKKLERTYVFDRNGTGTFTVTDDVEFSSAQEYGTCAISTDAVIRPGNSPNSFMFIASAGLEMVCTGTGGEIAMTDESLAKQVVPRRECDPHRLGVNFTKPITKGTITMTFKSCDTMVVPGPWLKGPGIETEKENVKTGINTIKWTHSNPTLKAQVQDSDWSSFSSIKFNVFMPSKRDGVSIHLCVESRPDSGAFAYYRSPVPLDFEGWKEFTLPFDKFGASGNPIGWNKVDTLYFSAKGWGSTPINDLTIIIDGLHLAR